MLDEQPPAVTTMTVQDSSSGAEPYTPDWLNALTEEERKSPALRVFNLRMHDSGCAHVAWLFWSIPTTPYYRQGSIFFLDCGRGPFAVTAGHVYGWFLDDIAALGRVLGCQIGNVGFNPKERLIAWGKNLGVDIATFRVTPEEIAKVGKTTVIGTDGAWPHPPEPGIGVFFCGFPGGTERQVIGPGEFSFGLHSAMTPLTSFTDYQVVCHLERAYRVDVRGLGLPPVGYDVGGMSGGPMLEPTYKDGAWGWRLVGVISEAAMQEDFETITAVRAHFILPDGRLSR